MRTKILAFSRSTFASMKKRNFRLYFIGQGVSFAGGWMQVIAQSWLVLHLTGSATALGAASALQYGPTLLIGPYVGVIADRFGPGDLSDDMLSRQFHLAFGYLDCFPR